MTLQALAAQHNADWRLKGLHREPGTFEGPQTPVTRIDGKEYVLFSSSNYLSLSTHPTVVLAARKAVEGFGTGSGGSRLTTGTTLLHQQCERAFADFVGSEDAVFFATGYQANLSTIQALGMLSPDITVFSDALNHASIIDGCRISRLQVRVFPHRDAEALGKMLANRDTAHALVVTDGLFSMDGDTADLPALHRVCQEHGAWLMVDDAHAIGTLGATGKGSAEELGTPLPDILIATASKALGAEGGFVCCSTELATVLRDRARSYVFSTATPATTPAAIMAALPLIPERLSKLRANIYQLCRGLDLPATKSPIIPIRIGDEAQAMNASQQLKDAGLWVPAIRYPTVAKGEAILRVTLMADHTPAQIDRLVTALSACR